jgi:hypothetical protein
VSQPIRRSRAAWPAVSTHSTVTVAAEELLAFYDF